PYGQQETFRENEVSYLSQRFEKVFIVPLFIDSTCREIALKNVIVMPAVILNKKELLSAGMDWNFFRIFLLGLKEIRFNISFLVKLIKQSLIVSAFKKYL